MIHIFYLPLILNQKKKKKKLSESDLTLTIIEGDEEGDKDKNEEKEGEMKGIEEKMKLRGRKYIGPYKSSAQIECEKKVKEYR